MRTRTPLLALSAILRTGPATVTQLAEQIDAQPRAVRKAVAVLEEHDLAMIVGRAPKEKGSRSTHAYLWGPGKAYRNGTP